MQSNKAKDWWTPSLQLQKRKEKLMVHVQRWRAIPAAIKRNTLGSFECWSPTRIIAHSTRHRSTTWWSDRKIVRQVAGFGGAEPPMTSSTWMDRSCCSAPRHNYGRCLSAQICIAQHTRCCRHYAKVYFTYATLRLNCAVEILWIVLNDSCAE